MRSSGPLMLCLKSAGATHTSHFISWHSSNSSILYYQSLSMYALIQLSTSHQYALVPQHPTQTLLSCTTPELLWFQWSQWTYCPHTSGMSNSFCIMWASPVKLPFLSVLVWVGPSVCLGWTHSQILQTPAPFEPLISSDEHFCLTKTIWPNINKTGLCRTPHYLNKR